MATACFTVIKGPYSSRIRAFFVVGRKSSTGVLGWHRVGTFQIETGVERGGKIYVPEIDTQLRPARLRAYPETVAASTDVQIR